jgi:hypothetical protein
MPYLDISLITIFLFLSGCSSIFPEHTTEIHKRSESAKFSAEQDIPQAKVRPYAYSGTLKRYDSFWTLPFLGPNYDYYISDAKGNIVAFLDISELATGTSLANLIDKTITVNGQTAPHKYRGVIIVKAKHIVVVTN